MTRAKLTIWWTWQQWYSNNISYQILHKNTYYSCKIHTTHVEMQCKIHTTYVEDQANQIKLVDCALLTLASTS